MKKLLSITVLAALVFIAIGCDKIDNPHKPFAPASGNKTVLIKDFTGVRCNNCPSAAETVHELQHQLGEDRVFIMSVHAGALATPTGKFPDFTTEEGTIWYNNQSSNPLFSVDHVNLTDGNAFYVGQVDAPLSDALAEPQLFSISIENTYDETTRRVNVENTFSAVGDGDGKYYATVCLLEDSIVGRQAVQGIGIDTAYVFRNVFRGTFNGADGELVSSGLMFFDDSFVTNSTMVLDSTYNADQCYILTYIYDYQNGKILQTEMKKIK